VIDNRSYRQRPGWLARAGCARYHVSADRRRSPGAAHVHGIVSSRNRGGGIYAYAPLGGDDPLSLCRR